MPKQARTTENLFRLFNKLDKVPNSSIKKLERLVRIVIVLSITLAIVSWFIFDIVQPEIDINTSAKLH